MCLSINTVVVIAMSSLLSLNELELCEQWCSHVVHSDMALSPRNCIDQMRKSGDIGDMRPFATPCT